MNKYNKRTIEASKVLDELIEIAKEVNKAYQRDKETGLSEEVAFYDAQSHNESAKEVRGNEKLRAIAHELTKKVKANMSIDWNLRESARVKMRVIVRRLLKKYGYPPDM